MNTSTLAQELAHLETQTKQVGQKHEALKGELRVVEAKLDTFSADRQRFDALREVLNALDKLKELKADKLFWEGIPEAEDAAGHVERLQSRIARFEGEISGILEKQRFLQEQINQCLDELDVLNEAVRDAYSREEQRKNEFVVDREISPTPYRAMIMPWSEEAESRQRLRRALLAALLLCLVFGGPISLIQLPVPDRSIDVVEIPERLVKLVKKEPAAAAPGPKPAPEELKQAKKEPEPRADQPQPDKPPELAEASARKKAERVGVLKFKDEFSALMEETSVPKLGADARLGDKNTQPGEPSTSRRSLVTMQAKGGTSGGIGNTEVSRNVGSGNAGRIGGGEGFVRVESGIGGLGGGSSGTGGGGGLVPSRTDEEIQIVFDRYKAALYRIYNVELRKNPTLRGKILMRISIEPNGAVSLCKLESTDLASPELVAKILERIQKFNFGPKEGVQKTTILYPIEFFPGG